MSGNKGSEKELIGKERFSEWYDNVLLEAKIADDRYPVKGFTVYTGWGFGIAKRIMTMLEERLEATDHEPMQFPVLIPEESFQREAEHIEGFGAEVFWITHAGENELDRRLLLRPTSETAIYPMFKLWVRSHADLPLRMHQTCNVYRYETKATRPLFRGREFLWNEAHTAHDTYEDAERQVRAGVEAYRSVYDRLGLSYITLQRPDFDKFAGAVYSLAFDAWNPDGKVNQIGTVHQLGHNFAKAFDLTYEDEDGEQVHAATTCYGMGFGRVLAAVISQHGDDHGIILPPVIAPKQVVIVPIPIKGKEADAKRYASKVAKTLEKAGVRVVLDDDDRLRPGEKFYKWEMYGVPLRIEIGPREAKSNTVTIVRRDTFEKVKADLRQLVPTINSLFDAIYENLSEKSRKYMAGTITDVKTVDELLRQIEERKIARINWCGDRQCADNLKEKVSGEIRGTLWGAEEHPDGPCILCGDPARSVAYFSRAY